MKKITYDWYELPLNLLILIVRGWIMRNIGKIFCFLGLHYHPAPIDYKCWRCGKILDKEKYEKLPAKSPLGFRK